MDIAASDEAYLQKVKQLQAQYAASQARTQPIALQKNTSNLFRNREESANKIDVRAFSQVLSVDAENLLAVVEGMTTYADLVDATLAHDCLPTVVPELKSITIGGALSGVGIESSSFRYGLVHETILEFDVLLGDGRVVTARPDNEYCDLFFAFPNSYGTLGYALRVVVKLIPAKPFVKLTHTVFTEPKVFFDRLAKISNEQLVDYVEGVVFDKCKMVISVGEFVDSAPAASNYKYMNIYYRSLLKRSSDYLTSLDYIWRWDPDWFWCSKFFYMQNRFLRFLFGKWLLKSTSYWKIKHLVSHNRFCSWFEKKFAKPTESVIQDVGIPVEQAQNFFEFFNKHIGIQPFWICPFRNYNAKVQFDFFKTKPDQLYFNFGFWDVVPAQSEDGYHNRLVEKKVTDCGGIKSLYSNAYYSEKEFWTIYNQDLYHNLKSKYDPKHALRDLYQKAVDKL